uniref:DUF4142 domain-containing protein n=1 Tax=Haptolina brevifila TaxID=156173 RepID=A0A7S2GAZ8_9EUKA|mmetsp:Transcript_32316/g.64456  ORF Transcript_32316/g.64456 Transcript_32316/m.64456 type:complete len:275 (+) Transcript_32316:35-859(+)
MSYMTPFCVALVLLSVGTAQTAARAEATGRVLESTRQAGGVALRPTPLPSHNLLAQQPNLARLAVLRGGSSSLIVRYMTGILAAPCLLLVAVFLQPFIVFARAPSAQSSAELWSMLRENLYNAEADNMHLTKVSGAAAAHAAAAREEAARKLIVNHESVLRDVTNANPRTQPDLTRLPSTAQPFVDQALREVARRLIGSRPGEDGSEKLQLSAAAQVAWAETAKYLDTRIQATAQEMPGRPPDMSEAAAAAMRAVLWEVGKGATAESAPMPVAP